MRTVPRITTLLALLVAGLLAAAPAGAQERPADDPLLAPPGRCAGDADPAAHHRTQRLAMHCLLRHLRREAKRRPLRSSRTLRHSATYKARRIAACRTFTHNPCGDRLDKPFREAQLSRRNGWVVGEDLAWGVGDDATARAVVERWLASASHRAVLLDRDFSHLGLRRRRLRMRGAPVGAVLWVAHLGRPARRASR
jgi:uncharacterized protein YkwD